MGFLFSCVITVMCSAAAAAHEIQPMCHCCCCWEQSGGYRQTVMSRCPCPPFSSANLADIKNNSPLFQMSVTRRMSLCSCIFFFFSFLKLFSLFPVWPRVQNRPLYCPTVAFMCKLSLCMNAKCLLRMHSVYLE